MDVLISKRSRIAAWDKSRFHRRSASCLSTSSLLRRTSNRQYSSSMSGAKNVIYEGEINKCGQKKEKKRIQRLIHLTRGLLSGSGKSSATLDSINDVVWCSKFS